MSERTRLLGEAVLDAMARAAAPAAAARELRRPSLAGTSIEHDAERLRLAEQRRRRKAASQAKSMKR